MSETLARVKALVARGDYLVSQHAAREMVARSIELDGLVSSLDEAVIVEDYPDDWKGPSVLVLQREKKGETVHALWGLEKGTNSPAVLVTAYWPDARRWSADFLRRLP